MPRQIISPITCLIWNFTSYFRTLQRTTILGIYELRFASLMNRPPLSLKIRPKIEFLVAQRTHESSDVFAVRLFSLLANSAKLEIAISARKRCVVR
jgi:hypothetical protein